MASESGQFLARGRAPEQDRMVSVTPSHDAAIRRKSQAVELPASAFELSRPSVLLSLCLEGEPDFSRPEVPEPDEVIRTSGDQGSTVGRKSNAVHRPCMEQTS